MIQQLLLQQAIPVLIGILAAFFSWLFVKYFFSPKLAISENISKKVIGDQRAYRIKIRNRGHRICSDISIVAKLEVRGLEPLLTQNFDSFFIKTSFNGTYPALAKGRSIVFHLFNETQYDEKYYSGDFARRIEESSSIEDLLSLTDDTKLIVYVLGTDNFSGVRKLFISKEYTTSSIVEKSFCKDSVRINNADN